MSGYKSHIIQEGIHWGRVAKKELKFSKPDYIYYKNTDAYIIYRNKYVNKALEYINEGDQVLELGSYNGWFSLEMARKGAIVDSYDIASEAIKIGENYYKSIKKVENIKGSVTSHCKDLNKIKFKNKKYDKVVIRSLLHHIVDPDLLIKKCKKVLKKNGLIIVDDNLTITKKDLIATGIILTVLPTDIPYLQKPVRILKKKKVLKRTRDLVEAKGTSPFESISGEESLDSLKINFSIIEFYTFSGFIGASTSQIRIKSVKVKIFILKILNLLERFLVKINILRGAAYFFVGKK